MVQVGGHVADEDLPHVLPLLRRGDVPPRQLQLRTLLVFPLAQEGGSLEGVLHDLDDVAAGADCALHPARVAAVDCLVHGDQEVHGDPAGVEAVQQQLGRGRGEGRGLGLLRHHGLHRRRHGGHRAPVPLADPLQILHQQIVVTVTKLQLCKTSKKSS